MRQAGVPAACALVALRDHVARLADDHALAQALARGLAAVPGLRVDIEAVETNMVYVHCEGGPEAERRLVEGLRERGVLATQVGTHGVRFVTHLDVGPADVERAIDAARAVLAAG